MGLQTSSFSTSIVGDTIGEKYDIYKIKKLTSFEYFKVYDLLEYSEKRALEPIPIKDVKAQELFKLIKKLNHPNIMQVEFFVDKDIFYIVRSYDDDYVILLEYLRLLTCLYVYTTLKTKNLKKYGFAWRLQIQRFLQECKCWKRIEIEEEQIIYWVWQLLVAVECLHKNNILHKFIMPEAISFKKQQLKLFIPAKSTILPDSKTSVQVEKTWFRYPPHELNKEIDLRYDIWAVGWTLYNICALIDSQYVLNNVDNFDTWIRPDIPRVYSRDLDRIYKIMTVIDPKKRPTASQMLQEPIFSKYQNQSKK